MASGCRLFRGLTVFLMTKLISMQMLRSSAAVWCPSPSKQGELKKMSQGHLGGWGEVHSVKRPTLAQVMISRLVGSSPAWGSVLTAGSLEPALDSVSPSLSAPSLLGLCLSVSQKINIKKVK